MGKASRTKQDPDRRARVAAQRAAARRAEQRRRLLLASGSILVVVIVVVVFVLIKVNGGGGKASASSDGPTGAALTSLVNNVTGMPANALDRVGGGNISSSNFIPASKLASASASGTSYFATVNGSPPLTSEGKPEMLYIGAEYCPFCGAERWSMIMALSRFGTFSDLKTSHSSSTDSFANTPTWTFYGSHYTSKYLSFVPVEEETNYRQGNSSNQNVPYATLQNPTSAEQALVTKWDPGTGQGGAIPFIDIGNKYIQVGDLSPFGPQDLQGKNWTQVAAALSQPSSAIAQGADGAANYLTAAICKLTNDQPASACTPAVKSLETKLSNG